MSEKIFVKNIFVKSISILKYPFEKVKVKKKSLREYLKNIQMNVNEKYTCKKYIYENIETGS